MFSCHFFGPNAKALIKVSKHTLKTKFIIIIIIIIIFPQFFSCILAVPKLFLSHINKNPVYGSHLC